MIAAYCQLLPEGYEIMERSVVFDSTLSSIAGFLFPSLNAYTVCVPLVPYLILLLARLLLPATSTVKAS